MDEILETIRASLAADASAEAHAAGVAACRAILTTLEPTAETRAPAADTNALPAETLVPPAQTEMLVPTAEALAAAAQSPPVAQLVGALRGMPVEQLLDLAIARLRAALPAGESIPPVRALEFRLIPVQRGR